MMLSSQLCYPHPFFLNVSFILCFSEWAYTKEEGVLSCVGSLGFFCLFVLAVFWGSFGAAFFTICTEL